MDSAHIVGEPIIPGRPGCVKVYGRGVCRWTAWVVISLLCWLPVFAGAQELNFLRIGTGGTGGTYFPVGGLIASAISNPPGSRDCELGGSCGVPGLIATAVSTQGSVDNVEGIASGQLDMALSQADVAYYAYHGSMGFEDKGPIESIRAIANLYPEHVHLVTLADSDIHAVPDLRGKKVGIGERASGTKVIAEIVLAGYRLDAGDVEPHYEKLGRASDLLLTGELDAFFMVGGYPLGAIAHAAESGSIRLVPISGAEAEMIVADNPFLAEDAIPADAYENVGDTQTLSVGAQLIAPASLDEKLVYEVTRALWHLNNRAVLDSGHPNGASIQLDTALSGVAIPLHPGAARYYDEIGATLQDDQPERGDDSDASKTE